MWTRSNSGDNMRQISEVLILLALLLQAANATAHHCHPLQSLLFARGASACLQSFLPHHPGANAQHG